MTQGQDRLCDSSRASTAAVPERERLDAWQALFKGAHAISAEEPRRFRGEIASVAVDAMMVHRMRATAQAVERTPAMVRGDGLDHIVLHLSASPMLARSGDDDIAVHGGAVSVNDLARPLRRAAAPDLDSVSVVLSRDLVASVLPDTDALHGAVLGQGAGALLRAHMRALAENAHLITREAAAATARGTAELLAASILSTPDAAERAREPIQAAALVRAKRYIDAHIAAVDLTPDSIARGVGVSRATLFRAFAPLGGVAAYVQDRRLTLVRRSLARRLKSETVGEIGYRFGFRSDVHLSRAFRRRFGMAPSDVRPLFGAVSPPALASDGRLIAGWLAEHG
ncbi:helix-turn-helix domain-containing protein [Lichenibacterium minor]|uniref:Helix-turn-helix domain-containing protein n=1 Tax=Lichenibacterium minor TaxID=2316528 RepID=A0A4Q2U5J4_9HYPH|nr:helix-turn-helix domain-containing protein [Lichenibacterium minor]RYC30095.1 helix-turn-helix domain-containing protein [Lichenibacterium minor]